MITTLHLILIALLAAVVIAGIVWGARQKRLRAAAEELGEERASASGQHADEPARDEPVIEPRVVPPVSPAPPPLDEGPPPVVPAPAPSSAAPSNSAPSTAASYRLIDLKGLGPKAVPLLTDQGVPDVATLAALSPTRAAEIDAALGTLAGRMTRDRWVEQAGLLVAGDVAGFEAKFGKL